MKQLFVFILVLCSFFLTSCTFTYEDEDGQTPDDNNGEVEETPGESETDNNSGSTGWLPWV